jgi:hypothetical protein
MEIYMSGFDKMPTPTAAGIGQDVKVEGKHLETADGQKRGFLRKRQWIYLLPVMGAPLAHMFVSGLASYPKKKQYAVKRNIMITGIVVSTATMIWNRLWLMSHAGYPGAEKHHGTDSESRFLNQHNDDHVDDTTTA